MIDKEKQEDYIVVWAYAENGFYKNPETKEHYSEDDINKMGYEVVPDWHDIDGDSWYIRVVDGIGKRVIAHSFFPLLGRAKAGEQAKLMLKDVQRRLIIKEQV